MTNPMLPILKRFGITEDEWRKSIENYERWGALSVPPVLILKNFEVRVMDSNVEDALKIFQNWYLVPSPPLILERIQPAGFESGKGGEYKDGRIILYPLAFRDKTTLLMTTLHEFAHHLQGKSYPFTGGIGELHKSGPGYTFVQRELFADKFTKEAMARLGYVWQDRGKA